MLDADDDVAAGELDAPRAGGRRAARWPTRSAEPAPASDAVGHRIVHGGARFREPVRRRRRRRSASCSALADLAPLHQPKSLAALDAVRRALPGVPAVACFDTAFHATLPPAAATYALPADVARALGAAPLRLPRPVARLRRPPGGRAARPAGGPAARHLPPRRRRSLAAVRDGRSVDTTMGFTPLEGLVMATRSGSVDPGLLLWLQRARGPRRREVADGARAPSRACSALAGTADMREVLARGRRRRRRPAGPRRLRAPPARRHRRDGRGAGRPRRARLHRRRRRARAAVRAAPPPGWASSASRSTADANAAARRRRATHRAGRAVRTLVVAAREDLEIAGLVEQVLEP